MAKTVVGLFDNSNEAQQVVDDLTRIGVPRSDISIARSKTTAGGSASTADDVDNDIGAGVATGATTGAVVGGAAGLIASLSALAIPGFGPVLAAGPIIATLTGAGIGAATGGLIGALVNVGVPEEEAEYYSEGVRRGGTLVSVRVNDELADRATDIMNRHHAIDIDERAATWRSSGWTPRGTTPTPAGTRAARSDVGRSERAEGKADADVQRTQRVPIAEEQALFVEEIVIDDRDRQRQQPGQQTREFRDEDFRDNYNTTYAKTGMTYDQVRPAYQYGTELAADQRYRGKDWSAFESDARRDWDSRHPGASTWDKVKAGVRHAWERTKAKVS